MNVIDAVDILKKYGLYDAAEAEIRNKRINKTPYDMQGHHTVYIKYLFHKWVELRDERDKLLKVKCINYDIISVDSKPAHDDCSYISAYCTKDCCKTHCTYYKDKIAVYCQKMDELDEAQNVLQEASDRDYQSR